MPPRILANDMPLTDEMRIMLAGFRIASRIAATDVPDLAWWIFTNQSSKNHITTVRCGKTTRFTRNEHCQPDNRTMSLRLLSRLRARYFSPSKYPVVQK